MNPLRKMIHVVMEATGLDARIDAHEVNARIEHRRQRRHPVLSVEEGNGWLLNALREGRPFAAGKIGDIELMALCWHLRLRKFYKYTLQPPSFGDLELDSNAGVFPRSERVFQEFAQRYLRALGGLDLAAVWHNPGEHQVLCRFAAKASRCQLPALEPWFASGQPWTSALAGKRVLVVHPFEETIRRQYKQREEIWKGRPEILPDLDLRTLKTPYGFSRTGFRDWMEMVSWLEGQMERIEEEMGFDVALIGCGAASLPLAAKARAMGKAGIHLGGPLQLLFGIRGKRWDVRSQFQALYNEAWCRPDLSEKPTEFNKVDQGGYW